MCAYKALITVSSEAVSSSLLGRNLHYEDNQHEVTGDEPGCTEGHEGNKTGVGDVLPYLGQEITLGLLEKTQLD